MNVRMKFKISVDALITLLLIFQMGYMLAGDLPHEITGTVTIVLWLVHNLLSLKWYSSVFRGRYPLKRVVDTLINFLLMLSVLGIFISSIILSSYVYSFLGIKTGMSFARGLHMVSVYWCFVLSSLHLGLHWSRVIKIIGKNKTVRPSRFRKTVTITASILISGFGLYAFIKNQIGLYMFRKMMFVFFDFEQSPLVFFLEYISMMVLFASLSYYFSVLNSRFRISGRWKNVQIQN